MQDSSISMFVFMPILYFVYGLSFLVLGITIAIGYFPPDPATGRFRQFISSPLGALSLFGMVHGMVEFIDTYVILFDERTLALRLTRLLLLSASFYLLCRFGALYGHLQENERGDGADVRQNGMGKGAFIWRMSRRLPEVLFCLWDTKKGAGYFFEAS